MRHSALKPGQSQANQDRLVTLSPDLHRPLFLDTHHGLLAVPLMSLQCPLGPPSTSLPRALSKIKLGCTCPCLKPLLSLPRAEKRHCGMASLLFRSVHNPSRHLQALYPSMWKCSRRHTSVPLLRCCTWPQTWSQLLLPHLLFVAPSNCNSGVVSPRRPS